MDNRHSIIFFNTTRKSVLAEHGRVAMSAFQRMRGLLGYSSLPEDQGLFLKPASCIHMRGMKFAIDVVFVNRSLDVVRLVPALQPQPKWKLWKMTGGGWRAYACFELPVGTIARTETHVGDSLALVTSLDGLL